MKFDNHIINPACPRMGNAFTRAVGSGLLKLFGWKIEGVLPHEPKVILVGEPHTSNWDFILIMCAAQAVGFRMSYIMKKEAFFWPLGGFFRWMGGLPIERKKDSYKTGYLRMAKAFDIPLFLIGIHGPTKSLILDRLVDASGDIKAQNKSIKDYMDATYQGIRPNNQRPGPVPDTPPDRLIGVRE